jgi:GMP reductase
MRIESDRKLDFGDVLIRPKRSTLASRKDVDLSRNFQFKHSKQKWNGIPIMASNMDGVGTFGIAEALQLHNLFTCIVKSQDKHDWLEFSGQLDESLIAVSTGISDKDHETLREILKAIPRLQFICIDVANGYSEHFGKFVNKVRSEFPSKTIIAGNVVTADMTQELILQGADIVKVGVGSGAVCTTRIQTGVGYPQLSAIIECADAAHGLDAHIIADGGCTCPGDVSKAFAAGADFVMLGSMLAGHTEGGGKIITELHQTNVITVNEYGNTDLKLEEKQFIEFYGMSSETAMLKHHGSVAEYRSSEGRTLKVPYKGSVVSTIRDILGGLRSTLTYVGAENLKQLSKCTTFIQCSRQFNDSLLK